MSNLPRLLLLAAVALFLATATQQAAAQCSGTTATKTEEPAIEQPTPSSQPEDPATMSQSDQAEATGVAEPTDEGHAPASATSAEVPASATIDATMNGAVQQITKGTKVVETGVKTVTKAAQAFDELLKAFGDEEPATTDPATEPR